MRVATVGGNSASSAFGDRLLNIDNIIAGAGNDTIIGNTGVNQLSGSGGNDTLNGKAGDDDLFGGAGNDTLIGGLGADDLEGGANADIFRYNSAAEGGDTVADMVSGTDKIAISKAGFGIAAGVNAATFAAEYFISGTDPVVDKAHGQFLYDTDTGWLSWDADGNGGDPAFLIATLTGAPVLAAADFQLLA